MAYQIPQAGSGLIKVSKQHLPPAADRTDSLLAGEEEVTYVYVDLQQAGDTPVPTARSAVTIQVRAKFITFWCQSCAGHTQSYCFAEP